MKLKRENCFALYEFKKEKSKNCPLIFVLFVCESMAQSD